MEFEYRVAVKPIAFLEESEFVVALWDGGAQFSFDFWDFADFYFIYDFAGGRYWLQYITAFPLFGEYCGLPETS